MDATKSRSATKGGKSSQTRLPKEQVTGAPSPAKTEPFFSNPDFIPIALRDGQVGVWAWDVTTGHVTWSTNLEDVLGVPRGMIDAAASVFETDVHPEDRPAVAAAMRETLQTLNARRITYRLLPNAEGPERWIETFVTAVVEPGKSPILLGLCRDVTHRAKVHHELRVRASQQEAIARLGEQALRETNLQKLFDDSVASIAQLLDVELVKILELVPGDAELLLRSGVGWKTGLVGTAYVSTGRHTHAGFTLASGAPISLENLASETRFSGSGILHDHQVVSGVAAPITGRDGRAYGVLTVHTRVGRKFNDYEVSFLAAVAGVLAGAIARLQLDQRQELMIRELRHRSGNLFAQLLALFSQTAKNSKTIAELATKYEARVLSLANAHRLITEGGWKSASLMDLLTTLLAPHLDRISLEGPNVFLEPDATFGVSMAVHELVTNANEHGSLSAGDGRVEIAWLVSRTVLGLTLTLDWRERQGPTPTPTRRTGFGSRLITMTIERQLNGRVEQEFGPDGLNIKLIIPITHERWPGISRPPITSPEWAQAYGPNS
jgi:PAS domain S-box-containing protein